MGDNILESGIGKVFFELGVELTEDEEFEISGGCLNPEDQYLEY